jgi:Lipocalin-like domain
MRRSSILAALALSLTFALAVPGTGVAQSQGGKPSLVGTWKLASVTAKLDTGEVIAEAYGPHPEGLLIYTANGRVTGIEAYDGRKPLSAGDRESAPVEERAEAFSRFISYAGSYEVAGNKVKHHIEASSLENEVNANLVHEFRFEGPDRLVLLTPPLVRNGARQVQEKVWERLK